VRHGGNHQGGPFLLEGLNKENVVMLVFQTGQRDFQVSI